MKRTAWILLSWLVVVSAFWFTCSVVSLSSEETCNLAGGEWNEIWKRCYHNSN